MGTSSSYGDVVTRAWDPVYLAKKALDGTNLFRGEQGLPPLKWNDAIAEI